LQEAALEDDEPERERRRERTEEERLDCVPADVAGARHLRGPDEVRGDRGRRVEGRRRTEGVRRPGGQRTDCRLARHRDGIFARSGATGTSRAADYRSNLSCLPGGSMRRILIICSVAALAALLAGNALAAAREN